MKSTLKKYWPSIVTVLSGIAVFATPSVQAWAGTHPAYSVPVVTLWGVVLHNLSAPKDT